MAGSLPTTLKNLFNFMAEKTETLAKLVSFDPEKGMFRGIGDAVKFVRDKDGNISAEKTAHAGKEFLYEKVSDLTEQAASQLSSLREETKALFAPASQEPAAVRIPVRDDPSAGG